MSPEPPDEPPDPVEGELVPSGGLPERRGSYEDHLRHHPLVVLFEAAHTIRSHEEKEQDRQEARGKQRPLTAEDDAEQEEVFERVRRLLELSDEEGGRIVEQIIFRTHWETARASFLALQLLAQDGGQISDETGIPDPTTFKLTAIDPETGKEVSFLLQGAQQKKAE